MKPGDLIKRGRKGLAMTLDVKGRKHGRARAAIPPDPYQRREVFRAAEVTDGFLPLGNGGYRRGGHLT